MLFKLILFKLSMHLSVESTKNVHTNIYHCLLCLLRSWRRRQCTRSAIMFDGYHLYSENIICLWDKYGKKRCNAVLCCLCEYQEPNYWKKYCPLSLGIRFWYFFYIVNVFLNKIFCCGTVAISCCLNVFQPRMML